jgi:hypothetical protein
MKTAQAYLEVYSKAILWLENPANRREAIDIMLAVSSLKPEDVEKSYDFLLGGHFFETTGMISSLDFHAPKFTSRCVDCPSHEPASRSSASRY